MSKKILKCVIIFLLCSSMLLACDPNSSPVDMFNFSFSPFINPAVFVLAGRLLDLPVKLLPQEWEQIEIRQNGARLASANHFFFLSLSKFFGNFFRKEGEKVAGRLKMSVYPVSFRVSKNDLFKGNWQILTFNLSLMGLSKILIYDNAKSKINFIDEIDSSTNFSLTTAWPPVFLYHFRVWNTNGMVYEWPVDQPSLPER